MTYNRMEAKPIAGEHCRFCGDAEAPLVKTPCCISGRHEITKPMRRTPSIGQDIDRKGGRRGPNPGH